VLLLVGAGCAGDAAESPRSSASIVFDRARDLWIATPETGEEHLWLADASQAAVSADGTRVAFVRDGSIWTADRDGRSLRRLTRGANDASPAWSPDGGTVYFSRREERNGEYGYEYGISLFAVSMDGSALRRLTRAVLSDHGQCHVGPAPSPDRRLVAFSEMECDHGADPFATAIGTDGEVTKTALLARFEEDVGTFDPAWAPDGDRLAFAVIDVELGERDGIYVADPSGADARRVAAVWLAGAPAWAPHDGQIAFHGPHGDGGRLDVWVVGSDGTGLRRVTRGTADESNPAWLPAAP
jgi:Tol biopolymer transport system component